MDIAFTIEERDGIDRIKEPVTVGIPFPKGFTNDFSKLYLFNDDNQAIPSQFQPLAYWVDQSIKWVLSDFQVNIQANKVSRYHICLQDSSPLKADYPVITTKRDQEAIIVNTGIAEFFLNTKSFLPFERVNINGIEVLERKKTRIVLRDKFGREFLPEIDTFSIETEGHLRTTFKIEGRVRLQRKHVFLHLISRISFFSGSGLVKIEYTVRNARRAKHPEGFWDLGDKGSIYFKDFSLDLAMAPDEDLTIEWNTKPSEPFSKTKNKKIEIYQDSSGGLNWDCVNHVNRFGQSANTFRGYRVSLGREVIKESNRASPTVYLNGKQKKISGVIKDFWQNFPKAIEAEGSVLTLRLFPHQYKDVFELQGGEQKTHTIFLSFENNAKLEWAHAPLYPRLDQEYLSKAKVFSYLIPRDKDDNLEYIKFIESAVKGENNFFARQELTDEYGWRNFGDLFADHETVYYKGPAPLISHYNNQYDIVYGALLQYLQSSNYRWYQIARNLADHVIDIDIYHTQKDKSAYNGGMFWHTVHYTHAATSTHRSYTRKVLNYKEAFLRTGGGPADEHNYTSGLLLYYYLTGNQQAKEAVLGLADWVINMDDGSKTIFSLLDRSDTGLSSKTVDFNYHGPGRGAGNSINALIDAYLLSGEKRCFTEAEKLIRRCIHPKDDISKRNLLEPERRWSYTVFLQIIGKYLDTKKELDENDYMYFYARESLIHYAKWMVDNEYVYLDKPEKLEYPTETWAAQEMRKTNVFLYAAKYSDKPLRDSFLRKAKFFYESSIKLLLSFETREFVRPLATLLFCGNMLSYFIQNPEEKTGPFLSDFNFGLPQKFVPQRIKAMRKAVAIIVFSLITIISCSLIFILTR